MSTDAGNAAAPEDAATRDVASERPGMESADPGAADSATATPETADRGVEGSADLPDHDTSEHDRDSESADTGSPTPDAGNEGFVATMLRDSTITGLPGDTGAPPEEPHAPEAQQQGDEPVGSERPSEDERNG